MFEAILMALEIALIILFFYTVYKVIWYSVKMLSLSKKLKALDAASITVTYMRKFPEMIFGKKGQPDFVINAAGKAYEVSVISFISTHSRWNIEKAARNYYIEVRKYNNVIYKTEKNSGTEPQHARDYRRESRFVRTELHISPLRTEFDKQILLIYPRPKLLTYTDTKLDYLDAGSTVGGHEIMYEDDFWALLRCRADLSERR